MRDVGMVLPSTLRRMIPAPLEFHHTSSTHLRCFAPAVVWWPSVQMVRARMRSFVLLWTVAGGCGKSCHLTRSMERLLARCCLPFKRDSELQPSGSEVAVALL
jgi:hypothetical protein